MSQQHTQFVGSIPENYDRHLGPLFFHHYADDLAARIDPVSNGVVLETACGTGISTQYLRDALADDIEIIATDLNEPMLDYARTNRGHLDNVHFEVADAVNLPYASESFDAVLCQFGLMFFPNKLASLRESHRVLKTGGQLLFNVWDSLEKNTIALVAHETIGGFFDQDPPRFLETPFGYYEADAIEALLEDAGFEQIQVNYVATTRELPSARNVAIGLVEGNPSILEIRERGTAEPEAVIDAVAAKLREEFGDQPLRTKLQALVFTARRV